MTDLSDLGRDRAYAVWLPSLRKIRQMAGAIPTFPLATSMSWRGTGLADPRAQLLRYWYAHTPAMGQQGLAFAAPDGVSWNDDLKPDLWSELTLRQTHR